MMPTQMRLLILAWTVAVGTSAPVFGDAVLGEPTTFMKPVHTSGKQAALVWIQGAATKASAYKPLLQAIQNASELSLWVGMPSFLGDTPEPARLDANIKDTLSKMRSAGFDKGPVYFGAHSLGTVFLQTWCASNKDECAGLILTGGFIARSNYYPKFSFPVPALTMGGSLDGLARVTRTIAESYYNQITIGGESDRFPVVVIEGMNHYSWGSGAVTSTEKSRDLKAEITIEDSHAQAAALAADWLSKLAGTGGGSKVAAGVARTGAWVKPLIDAYNLEGSRHFNSPRQIGGPGEKASCVKGGCPDQSAWAITAQKVMGTGLDGWEFEATNNFVDCKSTPITGEVFHLPHITNNTAKRTISTTTYSQCNWALGDKEDTGFVYTSASEIGSKLSSRQCILILGEGKTDTPFSVDDPDFCKMANEKAYQWALDHADTKTKARYTQHGQPFTFGKDIQKSGGPLFLDAGITYKDNGDAGVEVSSPAQKTEIDYWKKHFGPVPRPKSVPDPGCFHYCKLLSPARAMEWIYVDGLRRHYKI